jgi:hypothetical protein
MQWVHAHRLALGTSDVPGAVACLEEDVVAYVSGRCVAMFRCVCFLMQQQQGSNITSTTGGLYQLVRVQQWRKSMMTACFSNCTDIKMI